MIKTTKPHGGLADKIYKEEAFDCLKTLIQESKIKDGAEPFYIKKSAKKKRRKEIEKELRERFSEDDFKRLKTKKQRRSFCQANRLSSSEANVVHLISKSFSKRGQRHQKRNQRKVKKHSHYDTYINSKEWERRRNLYWQSHVKRCAVCDTASHIHLHHMSYEKFKNEPDEHLIPLCENHHAQYHRENGTQRNMIRKTLRFVEIRKGSLEHSPKGFIPIKVDLRA